MIVLNIYFIENICMYYIRIRNGIQKRLMKKLNFVSKILWHIHAQLRDPFVLKTNSRFDKAYYLFKLSSNNLIVSLRPKKLMNEPILGPCSSPKTISANSSTGLLLAVGIPLSIHLS